MAIRERTIGTCLYCGEEFTRKRISKKFCKPAHRTAYNRLPFRVWNTSEASVNAIAELMNLAKKHPHLLADVDLALIKISLFAQKMRSEQLVKEQ